MFMSSLLFPKNVFFLQKKRLKSSVKQTFRFYYDFNFMKSIENNHNMVTNDNDKKMLRLMCYVCLERKRAAKHAIPFKCFILGVHFTETDCHRN